MCNTNQTLGTPLNMKAPPPVCYRLEEKRFDEVTFVNVSMSFKDSIRETFDSVSKRLPFTWGFLYVVCKSDCLTSTPIFLRSWQLWIVMGTVANTNWGTNWNKPSTWCLGAAERRGETDRLGGGEVAFLFFLICLHSLLNISVLGWTLNFENNVIYLSDDGWLWRLNWLDGASITSI